jgi:hypothetical protein
MCVYQGVGTKKKIFHLGVVPILEWRVGIVIPVD